MAPFPARPPRGARLFVFATATIAIACASCFVVTGSTDGYVPVGVDATAPDADASGLSLGCLSVADCPADAGAQVCCLVVTSVSAATTTCQAGACSGALAAQLCAGDAECGNLACVSQDCKFAGGGFTLRACGALPTCTQH